MTSFNPNIRFAAPEDVRAAAALAAQLYSASADELEPEMAAAIAAADQAVFLAWDGVLPVGFAHCTLRRDYVEGTETSPVGYLEGVYVAPAHRRQGLAAALVARCEDWARAQGCSEFASDCPLDNTDSAALHLALGFTEANRIICFTRRL